MDEQIDAFFEDRADARLLFDTIRAAIAAIGPADIRVTKTQIAFAYRRAFAWAWTPDRWLRGRTAPLVLSIALPRRDSSQRWKQIFEPRPGRWMHHLEIWSATELDDEVRSWLREAAEAAQ